MYSRQILAPSKNSKRRPVCCICLAWKSIVNRWTIWIFIFCSMANLRWSHCKSTFPYICQNDGVIKLWALEYPCLMQSTLTHLGTVPVPEKDTVTVDTFNFNIVIYTPQNTSRLSLDDWNVTKTDRTYTWSWPDSKCQPRVDNMVRNSLNMPPDGWKWQLHSACSTIVQFGGTINLYLS